MATYVAEDLNDPEKYFQVYGYAGNASNPRTHTLDGDEDMQPDLIWLKNRTADSGWTVADSVRGANLTLDCISTGAEITDKSDGHVDSFTSTGFVLGAGTADSRVNDSGNNYVAFCWKESATSGFDIVAYTGNGSNRTIAHNLSAVPQVMITKGRSITDGWVTYHETSGNPILLALDATVADRYSSYSAFFNSTAPTSSVFSLGSDGAVNTDSATHIAYLWSGKQGFSKFGSYTGNGNADGPFVYTGFRPAYVMVKRTDATNDWKIIDNKRSTYNPTAGTLKANSSGAEDASEIYYDFCSNGYKIRLDAGALNASGGTYIYMAFAEAPFVNSNGVPCNAR